MTSLNIKQRVALKHFIKGLKSPLSVAIGKKEYSSQNAHRKVLNKFNVSSVMQDLEKIAVVKWVKENIDSTDVKLADALDLTVSEFYQKFFDIKIESDLNDTKINDILESEISMISFVALSPSNDLATLLSENFNVLQSNSFDIAIINGKISAYATPKALAAVYNEVLVLDGLFASDLDIYTSVFPYENKEMDLREAELKESAAELKKLQQQKSDLTKELGEELKVNAQLTKKSDGIIQDKQDIIDMPIMDDFGASQFNANKDNEEVKRKIEMSSDKISQINGNLIEINNSIMIIISNLETIEHSAEEIVQVITEIDDELENIESIKAENIYQNEHFVAGDKASVIYSDEFGVAVVVGDSANEVEAVNGNIVELFDIDLI